ncbi:hypothetical protein [Teichococcus vastitatis]|uniref:Uncharacterized protein n=1 Tax=Teichococcus vastitatis TaxID=2307076 RepID=A0ABS9W915_9PROT|nr:hypothetical protein [Pseudoroseomonas vastitatis]MCI0755797.1 hypothetical protein [Pseudoroseomonas vastitatis]
MAVSGQRGLLFDGLILAFITTRWFHPGTFAAAGREAGITYGTANTLLQLTSS